MFQLESGQPVHKLVCYGRCLVLAGRIRHRGNQFLLFFQYEFLVVVLVVLGTAPMIIRPLLLLMILLLMQFVFMPKQSRRCCWMLVVATRMAKMMISIMMSRGRMM
jgi:hypothetical protein